MKSDQRPTRPASGQPDRLHHQGRRSRSGRREAIVLAAIAIPILGVAVLAAILLGGRASDPAGTSQPPVAGSLAPSGDLVFQHGNG